MSPESVKKSRNKVGETKLVLKYEKSNLTHVTNKKQLSNIQYLYTK